MERGRSRSYVDFAIAGLFLSALIEFLPVWKRFDGVGARESRVRRESIIAGFLFHPQCDTGEKSWKLPPAFPRVHQPGALSSLPSLWT